MVVPDGHDEHHALGQGVAHLAEPTALVEDVLVAKRRLLLVAIILGDRVAGNTRDGRLRVGDDLAVLDVEALDVGELAARGDKLRDNSDCL